MYANKKRPADELANRRDVQLIAQGSQKTVFPLNKLLRRKTASNKARAKNKKGK